MWHCSFTPFPLIRHCAPKSMTMSVHEGSSNEPHTVARWFSDMLLTFSGEIIEHIASMSVHLLSTPRQLTDYTPLLVTHGQGFHPKSPQASSSHIQEIKRTILLIHEDVHEHPWSSTYHPLTIHMDCEKYNMQPNHPPSLSVHNRPSISLYGKNQQPHGRGRWYNTSNIFAGYSNFVVTSLNSITDAYNKEFLREFYYCILRIQQQD